MTIWTADFRMKTSTYFHGEVMWNLCRRRSPEQYFKSTYLLSSYNVKTIYALLICEYCAIGYPECQACVSNMTMLMLHRAYLSLWAALINYLAFSYDTYFAKWPNISIFYYNNIYEKFLCSCSFYKALVQVFKRASFRSLLQRGWATVKKESRRLK